MLRLCTRSIRASSRLNGSSRNAAALTRYNLSVHPCTFAPVRFLATVDTGHQAAHARDSNPIPPSMLNSTSERPQTLTEKIFQRYAVDLPPGKSVHSGDYITIAPQHCMSHDNSWPIAGKFMSMGATQLHNREQIVIALDHDVQNKSEKNLKKYRQIEEFATTHGVKEIGNFYPAGRGIGHQIIVEQLYAMPGTLVVASDSHSPMYGGIGCLGTAVVRSDAASIWATGQSWLKIPPVTKVTFTGTLPVGVTGKDVIVALCGLFSNDEVLNHAVEYTGSEETLRSLSIDDRLSIANMTTEFGGLSGLFPIDSVLEGWLRTKARTTNELAGEGRSVASQLESLLENRPTADPWCNYAQKLYLNLSTLTPYVSGPNSVKVATPLPQIASEEIPVNKAYLLSCTNARSSDFAAAANVFRKAAVDGKTIPKVPEHVNFYIAAASMREQKAAEASGDWQVLLDAGAIPFPSGCNACVGLGDGLLQPGEVGVSASNRNFKGRMGSTAAKAYLASPEVVAASALSGKISGPGQFQLPDGWDGVERGIGTGSQQEDHIGNIDDTLKSIIGEIDDRLATGEQDYGEDDGSAVQNAKQVDIFPGFPEKLSGEIVFLSQNDLNTDLIYRGELTYQDDLTTEQMAEACMHNYDPQFSSIVKESDIVVSGYNFGCGSSREQAATSILACKVPLVVAGSFGGIFSRNCINNALMALEVPRLVERLRTRFPPTEKEEKVLTRRTGWHLTWDVRKSQVTIDEGDGQPTWTVQVKEFPANIQEIIARGGLEKWVRARIEPPK